MGLEKREDLDHSLESVFKAAGYSEDIVKKELEPRAGLLGYQIVKIAGTCPTMAIEQLMDSPILKDPGLDNRDRAMLILMAGPIIASYIIKQAMDDPDKLKTACVSAHGFEHESGQAQHDVLKMDAAEWDQLAAYAEKTVIGNYSNPSLLVENLSKLLDDRRFNPLKKAIVEGFVIKRSAVEAAERMAPSSPGVIGPLAALAAR